MKPITNWCYYYKYSRYSSKIKIKVLQLYSDHGSNIQQGVTCSVCLCPPKKLSDLPSVGLKIQLSAWKPSTLPTEQLGLT